MVVANIFISQSWEYGNRHARLIDLLNGSQINYDDYCVPRNDSVNYSMFVSELKDVIEEQIKSCSCVLILYGACWRYSKWVYLEIEAAQKFNKPIIAVRFPDIDSIYDFVQTFATQVVDWDPDMVIEAIKRHDENYSKLFKPS